MEYDNPYRPPSENTFDSGRFDFKAIAFVFFLVANAVVPLFGHLVHAASHPQYIAFLLLISWLANWVVVFAVLILIVRSREKVKKMASLLFLDVSLSIFGVLGFRGVDAAIMELLL